MFVKPFGSLGFLDASTVELERLLEEAGRRRREQLLTRVSLPLRAGRLPSGFTLLTVESASAAQDLALAVLRGAQRAGGTVAVVDPAGRLEGPLRRHPGEDYQWLLYARPESAEEALAVLFALARSEAADLTLVEGFLTAFHLLEARAVPKPLARAFAELHQRWSSRDSLTLLIEALPRPRRRWWRRERQPEWLSELVGPYGPHASVDDFIRRAEVAKVPDGKGSLREALSEGLTRQATPEPRKGMSVSLKEALAGARKGVTKIFRTLPSEGRSARRNRSKEAGEPRAGVSPDGEVASLEEKHDRGWEPPSPPPGPLQATTEDAPPGPPGPEQRFVNTWFEGEEPVVPLVVGRRYRFRLQIGPRRAEAGPEPAPFVEPDWGDKVAIDLLISLYSEDFQIEGRHHRFILFRQEASEVLTSHLTPRRSGRLRLQLLVSLARELEVLQQLGIEVEAVEAPALTPATA